MIQWRLKVYSDLLRCRNFKKPKFDMKENSNISLDNMHENDELCFSHASFNNMILTLYFVHRGYFFCAKYPFLKGA